MQQSKLSNYKIWEAHVHLENIFPSFPKVYLFLYLISKNLTFTLKKKTNSGEYMLMQLLLSLSYIMFLLLWERGLFPQKEKISSELVIQKHIKYNSTLHCSLRGNMCFHDVDRKTRPIKAGNFNLRQIPLLFAAQALEFWDISDWNRAFLFF